MSSDDNKADRRQARGLLPAFGRFKRNRDGATAIEFAMLAVPFCLLLFAILESCISFAAQQVMSNITDNIAREIRTTGKLRNGNALITADATNVKARICTDLGIIVTTGCQDNLTVDLRQFATFALAAAAAPIKFTGSGASQDIDTTGFDVKPGGAKTRNMLRVFYRWPVMTDMLRLSMSNIKNTKTLHFAIATWSNEPF